MFSAKNDQTDNKLSSNFQSEENCLQKIYNDENMSSNLRQYAGWKENYYKREISSENFLLA